MSTYLAYYDLGEIRSLRYQKLFVEQAKRISAILPEEQIAETETMQRVTPMEWKEGNLKLWGITEAGFPIIGDKPKYGVINRKIVFEQFTDSWNVGYSRMTKIHEQIFIPTDTSVSNDSLKSFKNWRERKPEQLAFIYRGIFWKRKSGTTLEQTAKRVFEHFSKDRAKVEEEAKKNGWKRKTKYLEAIFHDGGLIFIGDKAILKMYSYADIVATMWSLMAVCGYFPWVKEVCDVEDILDFLK